MMGCFISRIPRKTSFLEKGYSNDESAKVFSNKPESIEVVRKICVHSKSIRECANLLETAMEKKIIADDPADIQALNQVKENMDSLVVELFGVTFLTQQRNTKILLGVSLTLIGLSFLSLAFAWRCRGDNPVHSEDTKSQDSMTKSIGSLEFQQQQNSATIV